MAKTSKNPALPEPLDTPDGVEGDGVQPSAGADETLPNDFREALALLAAAEALAERTPSEQRDKQRQLGRIRSHVFQLQQGLPLISLTADDLAPCLRLQNDEMAHERLRLLARHDRDVQNLLDENEALRSENARLKARK